jgi:hypothetical protein
MDALLKQMSVCTCNDNRIVDTVCNICETKIGEEKETCPVHRPICGSTVDRTCEKCKERGLKLVISGKGGCPHVTENGKYYALSDLPKRPLILNF